MQTTLLEMLEHSVVKSKATLIDNILGKLKMKIAFNKLVLNSKKKASG
jgi:hypothetical protein